MSDEPEPSVLERLTPLPITQRSTAEKHRATLKRDANRADYNPHAAVREAERNLAAHQSYPVKNLTLEEQTAMTATLMRQFYGEATGKPESGERMTANGRKQAAIAYGVVTDKLAMLHGRPKQTSSPEEMDDQRPGVLELGNKLARLAASAIDRRK